MSMIVTGLACRLVRLWSQRYDTDMHEHGFYRVAAAVPRVQVANVRANLSAILRLVESAAEHGCDLVIFPELSLTGYACADLFQQETLVAAAVDSLRELASRAGELYRGLAVVGLPLRIQGKLYNTAAVLHAGEILALVPKRHLPTYREFYERRWFSPGSEAGPESVRLGNEEVPFGTDLLIRATDAKHFTLGIEICEDLWVPIPPSSSMALAGATLLANLSASNEGIGKSEYRRSLVAGQSGRCIAGYVYCSAGVTESTTDLVFGGHCLIAENGVILRESERFQRKPALWVADVDLERTVTDRARMGTFHEPDRWGQAKFHREIPFTLGSGSRVDDLQRHVPALPFVPSDPVTLKDRCEEIFHIQTAGLAKRIEVARPPSLEIGISGGLDSTLALLVAVKTCDMLGLPRSTVHGLTMPGFGTSDHTLGNARGLMGLMGIRAQELDIRPLCLDAFKAMGHQPFGLDPAGMDVERFVSALSNIPREKRHDLVFENVQARIRTLNLMNYGFVIGTGDLSELALGWCTYNGDHMGMYNPNASIPKTLVRFLVRWVADNEFDGAPREVLHSIADTEISPELLPLGTDAKIQSTEETIGPYELLDFFLYNLLRFGFRPRKVLFLAEHASFSRPCPPDQLQHWLALFLRRFFNSQFKRSCLPDGPKVGSISLSPRGDWRMPSDAEVALWLEDLET